MHSHLIQWKKFAAASASVFIRAFSKCGTPIELQWCINAAVTVTQMKLEAYTILRPNGI